MADYFIMNMDLWSGFFGNIIGALIGGIIAYLIVKLQIKSQDKQQQIKEIKDKEEKEIQLFWQIYFDIKKDCENAKLWNKYEEILQERERIWGSPTAEYVNDTLQYIMRDIKNFFVLLRGKENDTKNQIYNELDLLWERAGQLLIFMYKLYEVLKTFNKKEDELTITYYVEAMEIFHVHNKTLQNKHHNRPLTGK